MGGGGGGGGGGGEEGDSAEINQAIHDTNE